MEHFPVLGVRPTLGRLLGSTDDRTMGESEVVVLGHAYWQSHLGGRRDIVDETIVVNGQPMTIVGVAPKGFEGTTLGLRPDVFMPITMRWRLAPEPRSPPENRRGYWVYLFARLKPDVALEQARAILNEVEAPLQEGMSDPMMAQFKARGLRLDSGSRGQSSFAADARAPLTLLLAVTTLLLVIACVNVANLLLARATARSKEMATRLSLGATRARLIAQLFTESSVLRHCSIVSRRRSPHCPASRPSHHRRRRFSREVSASRVCACRVSVQGYDAGSEADRETRYDEIGHGYFRTLGVPLISGREFTSADSENAAKVAIINERFARKFGLAREAVGKRMSRDTPALDLEIVGLVRDFQHSGLRDAPRQCISSRTARAPEGRAS